VRRSGAQTTIQTADPAGVLREATLTSPSGERAGSAAPWHLALVSS
jgi:hypothetical protein